MQFANNKFIATLVISNVVAFGVIFILIWMLWQNSSSVKRDIAISHDTNLESFQQEQTLKPKKLSIEKAINQEVKSANLEPAELANTDSPDTDALSYKAYIETSKKVENNQKPKLSYSEKEIKTAKIVDQNDNAKTNKKNNINAVDVSQKKSNAGHNNKLKQQITALVDEKNSNSTSDSNKNPGWQDYLKTLKVESQERKNEMRTIKVKRGETLWRISIRAYGTGFKYKKIFKANPHLTSPHSITTGEILKVPL